MKSTLAIFALLLIGSLALPATLRAQSDPMAKWKPNVGDKFVYDRVHSYWQQQGGPPVSSSGRDTLVIEIYNTDTVYHQTMTMDDSTYEHVVVTSGGIYHFYPGRNALSSHSVAFKVLPFIADRGDLACDFSSCPDSQTVFGSRILTAYRDEHYSYTEWSVVNHNIAVYSPELRWFLYIEDDASGDIAPSGSENDYSSQTLISASWLKVNGSPIDTGFVVESSGSLLRLTSLDIGARLGLISLLDVLGRQVRSWPCLGGDGPREITLNVADVPSGVYFLKLTAPGVEEVRKVCIAH